MDAERPDAERASAPGIPVAPSLAATLAAAHVSTRPLVLERRDAVIAAIAIVVALGATAAAEVLVRAIALVTNLAFYGRWSLVSVGPAGNTLGYAVIAIPVAGSIVVGLMARYGSRAIRGHGIPEAMEQVLTNESRVPLRMTFLKPVSSAIAIGTGGPFGAEGPIIATGGALGSALGQLIKMTANERKTVLAAGAAAGMTAIFGTPIAGVLLAIELLLFEYRARSVMPVALACATAGALRVLLHGGNAVFAMPELVAPGLATIAVSAVAGGAIGVASTWVTRLVYAIEDGFERLPIHWMWWPAIGAVVVGVIGVAVPHTLGVGYDNIERALGGDVAASSLAILCVAKLVSWAVALGSGTSGGTLAPLLTFGSALGWLIAAGVAHVWPAAGIDPRVGALVGMAAMFAGASRALLTSIVFALESTQQLHAAIPVVAGVTLAYTASALLMRTTIMTEKLARRGIHAEADYGVDPLALIRVGALATRALRTLAHDTTAAAALAELAATHARHQAYPIVDGDHLLGVVTRLELLAADPNARLASLVTRPPVVAWPGETARDAVERMAEHGVGRLIVVERLDPKHAIGILTRSDLVAAFRRVAATAPHAPSPPRIRPLRVLRILRVPRRLSSRWRRDRAK